MQDLHSTYPPQETYVLSYILIRDYTAPLRPRELDHAADRGLICSAWQISITEVGTDHTDHLSEAWTVRSRVIRGVSTTDDSVLPESAAGATC